MFYGAVFACILLALVVGPFMLPLLYWPYVGFLLFLDRGTPENSGRPLEWARNLKLFGEMARYFPVKFVREGPPVDPQRKYLFCYHPHGVISFGAFLSFATNALDFPSLFPGIDRRLLTLDVNFKFPFLREILLSLGLCSVSKTSIVNHLSKPGRAVAIVTGGAAESLQAKPGTYHLTLKHRKGFAKVALQTQADLIPVFGFGENDVYEIAEVEKGGFIERMQKGMKKYLSFTIPMLRGRGITGLLPLQEPIFVVAGEPIPCPKLKGATPTQEEIDDYHDAYVRALIALYNRYKKNVSFNRIESLRLE